MTTPDPTDADAPIRFARPRPVPHADLGVLSYWPFNMLPAIFLPVMFFRSIIHRMSVLQTILSGLLNVIAAVVIIALGIIYEEGGFFDYKEWLVFLLGMACLALGTVGFLAGLTLLVTPAVAGAAHFKDMFLRALHIVLGTTAVYPLATLTATVMILCQRFIREEILVEILGNTTRGEAAFVGLIAVFCVWPFVMLLVGLFVDGSRTRSDPYATGQKRCETCGYSLVVLSHDKRCPDCGHPAASSMDPNRRRLPVLEAVTGPSCIPAAMTSLARALVRPATHWRRWRVRRSGRRARNAYLCSLVLGMVLVGLTFVAAFPFVLWLSGERRSAFDMEPVIVVGFFMAWSALVLFLFGNQTVLLLAIALAKLRGDRSRIDELARIGYYSLGLPVILQCFLAIVTLMLTIYASVLGYSLRHHYGLSRSDAEFIQVCLVLLVCLAAALVIAVSLWALVSMVRGMCAARHANF